MRYKMRTKRREERLEELEFLFNKATHMRYVRPKHMSRLYEYTRKYEIDLRTLTSDLHELANDGKILRRFIESGYFKYYEFAVKSVIDELPF